MRLAVPETRPIDPLEAAAVLGGVREPGVTLERALELFWTLAKDRTLKKSGDQLRCWKAPRITAVIAPSFLGSGPIKFTGFPF